MYQKSFSSSYGFYLTLFSSIVLGAMVLHSPEQASSFFSQSWQWLRSLSFQNITDFLSGISYIGGVGFGIKSASKLKEHHETHGKIPLSQPITLGIVAALLLALPTMMANTTECNLGTNDALSNYQPLPLPTIPLDSQK